MSQENLRNDRQPSRRKLPLSEQNTGILLELDTLSEVSARLNAAESFLGLIVKDQSFNAFMHEVLAGFIQAIPSETGSILEADYTKKILFFRAVSGRGGEGLSNVVIPLSSGIVGHVVESKTSVLIEDTAKDTRFLSSVASLVNRQTQGLIAAPILIRNTVFCVVELFNRLGKPNFDQQDLELLKKISGLASRAIEARLMLNRVSKAQAA